MMLTRVKGDTYATEGILLGRGRVGMKGTHVALHVVLPAERLAARRDLADEPPDAVGAVDLEVGGQVVLAFEI